jgi:hypothetical protein
MIVETVAKGASLLYGMFTLLVFTALAALDGSLFRNTTDKETQTLGDGTPELYSGTRMGANKA